MRLNKKVALVTGGTSGIGKAIATRFAQEGARVAIVGSTDRHKAAQAAGEISPAPAAVLPFIANVADPAQVERLVTDITKEVGEIDILINAAGVWLPTPLGETLPEDVAEMVGVNFNGTLFMMNAVVPGMKARKSGNIVNLSSIAALVPSPGYAVYAAVKAAVNGLTRAAAVELAPFGVHVNAISPGNTETPMNEFVRKSDDAAKRRDWIKTITPSNRSFTPPTEIAAAALFLVSGEVGAMYGTILTVDEGRSAGLPSRQ